VSRARALCEITGAVLYMAANGRVVHPYSPVSDGDRLSVGGLGVAVLSTPGHTHESVCYLVEDLYLLSGDTLFIEGIGRPDLERGQTGMDESAAQLHDSLYERLFRLPPSLRVFPGRTGPEIGFDGVVVEASLGTLRDRVELLGADRVEFTARIKERLAAPPPNYRHIIMVNEGKLDLDLLSAIELEAGSNRCAIA